MIGREGDRLSHSRALNLSRRGAFKGPLVSDRAKALSFWAMERRQIGFSRTAEEVHLIRRARRPSKQPLAVSCLDYMDSSSSTHDGVERFMLMRATRSYSPRVSHDLSRRITYEHTWQRPDSAVIRWPQTDRRALHYFAILTPERFKRAMPNSARTSTLARKVREDSMPTEPDPHARKSREIFQPRVDFTSAAGRATPRGQWEPSGSKKVVNTALMPKASCSRSWPGS